MTAGIPIRVRRTISDTPIDPVQLGGMLWHIHDQKLGIFNGTQMAWYPGVDPTRRQFILNPSQRLTGKAANGADGQVGISFDTPGEIRFINLANENVLARFTANGAVTFANPQVTGVLPGGSLQKTSHPGFIPNLFRSKNTDTAKGFVGPNTYLWKKTTGADGNFSVSPAYKQGGGASSHVSAESYTLKVEVINDPGIATAGVGLRTWLFDTSLSSDSEFTNNHRFFLSIIGPKNGSNTLRIGREGSYIEKEIIATGAWQRVFIDVPSHLITEDYTQANREPLAVDMMYKTTPGIWYLSEPNVQNIDVVTTEIPQYRPLVERLAIADAYYWAPPTQIMNSNVPRAFSMPTKFPIVGTYANFIVETISTDRPVVLSLKERQGFRLAGSATTAGLWNTKFAVGYHGRLTDIT